ncbi:hypothetical protein CHS0354_034653 [Potamilus streckersoni]|uniref:Uncharacterized protein n=1 Tax=Potamilus streckersoni TaxID=2493646 RepID=A0AAE0WB12_9BIVA|nr:hypothetical protein CHS0354_034653 [Potamilus streckersoni]
MGCSNSKIMKTNNSQNTASKTDADVIKELTEGGFFESDEPNLDDNRLFKTTSGGISFQVSFRNHGLRRRHPRRLPSLKHPQNELDYNKADKQLMAQIFKDNHLNNKGVAESVCDDRKARARERRERRQQELKINFDQNMKESEVRRNKYRRLRGLEKLETFPEEQSSITFESEFLAKDIGAQVPRTPRYGRRAGNDLSRNTQIHEPIPACRSLQEYPKLPKLDSDKSKTPRQCMSSQKL